MSRLSHIERIYNVEGQGISISVSELQFVPEGGMSVCWLFRLTNRKGARAMLTFVANPTLNLMWEFKQIGGLWRERKELLFYDEGSRSVIARDQKRSNWIAILGSDTTAITRALGIDALGKVLPQNIIPYCTKPCYGNTILTYPLSLGPGESKEILFALTGGTESLYPLMNQHQFALSSNRVLMQTKNDLYTEFMESTVNIECPSELIQRAFDWSKVNLQMLKHFQPGFGLGYMAGLPHFMIYFGRDIGWTAIGATAAGDFETVRESLLLLARFQASSDGEDELREPFYKGEIAHEIRTEGTVYYYSADATPLFVMAAYHYYRWSKDEAFLTFIYKNIVDAMEWCINADRDEDGLVEHGPEGFLPDTTWMDSLYRGKSAVDVQAIFCYALLCGSKVAGHLNDRERAEDWLRRHERLKRIIFERYWNRETRFLNDTILPDGSPLVNKTINAVIPVLFRLTPAEVSEAILEELDSPDFMTDWGVRTRAKSDPEYDPRSYQKGGVWPLCTGWVTCADFRWNRYEEGLRNIMRLANSLEIGSNYFKEILYGDIPPTGTTPVHPSGCFIQAWSAGVFLYAVITCLYGMMPVAGGFSFTPYMADGWDRMAIKSVRIGEGRVDARAERGEGMITIEVTNHGPRPMRADVGFVLPRLIRDIIAREGDTGLAVAVTPAGTACMKVVAPVELEGCQTKRVNFSWSE